MSNVGSNQVYANAEEIRTFARELARFCDHVEFFDTTVRADLARLGDTFRDDGYEQFCSQFAESRKGLARFLADARFAVKALEEDAVVIDKFRNVKTGL